MLWIRASIYEFGVHVIQLRLEIKLTDLMLVSKTVKLRPVSLIKRTFDVQNARIYFALGESELLRTLAFNRNKSYLLSFMV